MATDYTKLDELILNRVNGGYNTFARIVAGGGVVALSNQLATPDRHGDRNGHRVVDRRLQALRNAGKLTYTASKGWRIAEKTNG